MSELVTAQAVPPVAKGLDAARVAELTASFFGQAVGHEVLGRRLRRADTSVHLHLAEGVGVTLRLDQAPIVVEPRIVGEAEVELWMTPELLVRCARGEQKLQIAIMQGKASYRGPVRKLTFVLPVLRTFDHALWSRRSLG